MDIKAMRAALYEAHEELQQGLDATLGSVDRTRVRVATALVEHVAYQLRDREAELEEQVRRNLPRTNR